MINTFNESHLHKALKTFYAVQFSAQEEVKVGRWICDLVRPDGSVVEIQTKNVNSLKEKIFGLLNEGRRVTIVRPIVREKIIETYSQDGELVSRRKSPKKESLYAVLSEFTGLAPLLCDKKLAFLFPEISALEKRVKLSEPEQSKNKRRRFRKDWQKTDKALLTIGATAKFCGKSDWLSLLPMSFSRPDAGIQAPNAAPKSDASPKRGAALRSNKNTEPFCASLVRDAFLAEQKKEAAPHANLLLWLLREAGLIVRVPHEGRGYYYQLSTMSSSSRFSMS